MLNVHPHQKQKNNCIHFKLVKCITLMWKKSFLDIQIHFDTDFYVVPPNLLYYNYYISLMK